MLLMRDAQRSKRDANRPRLQLTANQRPRPRRRWLAPQSAWPGTARMGTLVRQQVVLCGRHHRAAHASSNHGRADEVPDAGRLDRDGGDGVVRADLPKLRPGDGALPGAGGDGHGGAVRERTRVHAARPPGGKAEDAMSAATEHTCWATTSAYPAVKGAHRPHAEVTRLRLRHRGWKPSGSAGPDRFRSANYSITPKLPEP